MQRSEEKSRKRNVELRGGGPKYHNAVNSRTDGSRSELNQGIGCIDRILGPISLEFQQRPCLKHPSVPFPVPFHVLAEIHCQIGGFSRNSAPLSSRRRGRTSKECFKNRGDSPEIPRFPRPSFFSNGYRNVASPEISSAVSVPLIRWFAGKHDSRCRRPFLSASSAILFLTSHYPPLFLPPFFRPAAFLQSAPLSPPPPGWAKAERTAVLNIGFFLSTIPFSFLSIFPGSFLPHNPFFPFRSLRKSPPPLTFFLSLQRRREWGKGVGSLTSRRREKEGSPVGMQGSD